MVSKEQVLSADGCRNEAADIKSPPVQDAKPRAQYKMATVNILSSGGSLHPQPASFNSS